MFTLAVENERGERLELTHRLEYSVVDVQGLTPPNANINTTEMAGGDGSSYNSSSLTNRNIVILLYINSDIERNRQRLYRYFRVKRQCRIHYKNASRNVYIDGHVETVEPTMFKQTQAVQISILCPDPYLKNETTSLYEFSWTASYFEFPFSIPEEGIEFSGSDHVSSVDIINNGENEVGVEINLTASGAVLNPKIINVLTGEYFALNVDLDEGDVIKITTHRGKKRAILYKGGEEKNVMNAIASGSTWFKIDLGDNIFSYAADLGGQSLAVSFTFTEEFVGV